MRAFLYETVLQLKLDIRSKTMLISCYIVPLIFFVFMGGIFTSITPDSSSTLIASMSVFVVSMGAFIGLPPSLVEIYGSDIKKVYKANGVPMFSAIATHFISAFIHLYITCLIVFFTAPLLFDAKVPENLPRYFAVLALFIISTLSIGCVLGLLCKTQSKLTMISQIFFLPSIMLSGIMFPASMLPDVLKYVGYILPATAGFGAMTDFQAWHLPAMLAAFAVMMCLTALLLKKISKQ